MLFPDTIWYGKQSMVKFKRNKEDFRGSIYRFSSSEFKSNLINQNRKGCGAKRFGLTDKRKLRIINRVRSDENMVK